MSLRAENELFRELYTNMISADVTASHIVRFQTAMSSTIYNK